MSLMCPTPRFRDLPRWTAALMLGLTCVGAAAAPDRLLRIEITAEGSQAWKNDPQWAESATQQRYAFSTTLRTTGRLEGANLLNPDMEARMAIKAEYLRRNGAAQIKAAGFDPEAPDIEAQLRQGMDREIEACGANPDCQIRVTTTFLTLIAVALQPNNSHLFEGEPRYRFYFGYPDCRNEVDSSGVLSLKGEASRTGKQRHLKPYELDVTGRSSGTPEEQRALCQRFTVVWDTKADTLHVENVYLPAARGPATRSRFGTTMTLEMEVPPPAPLQGWVNDQLRNAPLTGNAEATIPLTLPPDGDGTLLGRWSGSGDFTVKWSFTEVTAPR